MNRRTRHESGFALVEVLVALAILGGVIAAAAGSMAFSARLNTSLDERAQALSIAEATISRVQAQPWSRTGFAPDDPGYVEWPALGYTVTLPEGTPADGRVLPVEKHTVNGTVFTATTEITWLRPDDRDNSTRPGAFGMRRIAVEVSWLGLDGQTRIARQTTTRTGGTR